MYAGNRLCELRFRLADRVVANSEPPGGVVTEPWFRSMTKSVTPQLEAKARSLAGIKGYVTNLAACPDGTPVTAGFVISSYRRLFEIEKASGCPSTTCRPGPSTTTCATRSRPP